MRNKSISDKDRSGLSYIGRMEAEFFLNGTSTHTFKATSIQFTKSYFAGYDNLESIDIIFPREVIQGDYKFEYKDGDGGDGGGAEIYFIHRNTT